MHTDIIIAIIGLVAAVFASQGFWTWLSNRNRKKSSESKLLLGIAYSKIIQLCEEHIKRGSITAKEFHELEHYLYEPYREMGGNGTVVKLFDDVKELPIVAEKETKKK